MASEASGELQHHPLATIFPMMEGAEFEALVADIREHGVREPVVLFEGAILDGRNRHKASLAAGRDCPMRQYEGDDALSYVLSHNLHRRHLNEAQRSVVAAKLVNLKHGSNQYLKQVDGVKTPSTCSAGQAADLMNVSRSSVNNAKLVLVEGTPDELKAVEEGKVGVRAAADTIRHRNLEHDRRRVAARQPKAHLGKNPARAERGRADAAVYQHLRAALEGLCDLPLPADVAAMIRRTSKAGTIDARLPPAFNWLKEFAHVWSNRDQAAA